MPKPVKTATPKKTPKSKSKKVDAPARPVLYPEPEVILCYGPDAITPRKAQELLGWEEETDTVKFGPAYILTDENGKKVRCANNARNRPFSEAWARTIAQDILHKHWAFNGEAIIIGKSGQVLSGQHRLIGLVLADQMRSGRQKAHWEKFWPNECTIDAVVVRGIEETGVVTRTLDNVKPRSLSDVLVTDTDTFGKVSAGDRVVLARMLDYAVRFLWHRTGQDRDAFAPRRTHSEALDFIDRHQRVKKAVLHIWEENQVREVPSSEGKTKKVYPLSEYIMPGYAAGLMYMMGCCSSDGDTYHLADPPSEKKLKWDYWEKAEEFFTLLASAPDFQRVRDAFAVLANDHGGRVPRDKAIATLIQGWGAFLSGRNPDDDDLRLSLSAPDDLGRCSLTSHPALEGIDRGEPGDDAPGETPTSTPLKNEDGEEDEEEGEDTADPTDGVYEAPPEENELEAAGATQGENLDRTPDDPTPEEIAEGKLREKERRAEEAKLKEEARLKAQRDKLLAARRKSAPNNRLGGLK